MKRLLPLHEMAVNFGLVSNHPVRKRESHEQAHRSLQEHPDLSFAQVHDWLREHFPDFPCVSAKMVFNYGKIVNADLLACDDIMLLPVYREEATALLLKMP